MFLPEDYDPEYPPRDSKNISSIIYSLAEFRECLAGPDPYSDVRVSDKFFNTQVFVQRYLTAYRNCALFHEKGSGKSRSFEAFRIYMTEYRPGEVHKYIIVAQQTLLNEYARQIRDSIGVSQQKGNSRADLIKYGYYFHTMDELRKELEALNDENVAAKYGSCAFFFEEIHKNLRITEESTNLRTDSGRASEYRQCLRLTTLCPNAYYLFVTGTPIVNKRSELIYYLNLLPGNRKIETKLFKTLAKGIPNKFSYTDVDMQNLEQLEPFLRGRVLYAKSPYSGAVEVPPNSIAGRREVEYDETSKRYLTKYSMSDFQSSVFLRNYNRNLNIEEVAYANSLDSSVFVYPSEAYATVYSKYGMKKAEQLRIEGEKERGDLPTKYFGYDVGDKGFAECIVVDRTPSGKKMYKPKSWFKDYLKSPGAIQNSGVKIYDILKTANETSGVYYASCTRKHIIILLTIIFNLNEYTEFDPDNPVNYGKTYASLRSENKSRYAKILETTAMKENIQGRLLKVVLTMPVASVGINIGNVTAVNLLDPKFTDDDTTQRRDRAFRPSSYRYHEIKPVKVQVFYSCAYAILDGSEESVDIATYQHISSKSVSNMDVINAIVESSVDRAVNSSRNQDDFVPIDLPVNYKTYNAYYAKEYVQACSESILELLSATNMISVERVNKKLIKYKPRTIELSIKSLAESSKPPMRNNFGFPVHVCHSNGYIFICQYPQLEPDAMLAYYESVLHMIERKTLEDSVQLTRADAYKHFMERLDEFSLDDILAHTVPNKISLLEESYLGKPGAKKDRIKSIFKKLVYEDGDVVVHQLNSLYSGTSARKPVVILVSADRNLRILDGGILTTGPKTWRSCTSEECAYYGKKLSSRHKDEISSFARRGQEFMRDNKIPGKQLAIVGLYGIVADGTIDYPRFRIVSFLKAKSKEYLRGANLSHTKHTKTVLDSLSQRVRIPTNVVAGKRSKANTTENQAVELWEILKKHKLIYNFLGD